MKKNNYEEAVKILINKDNMFDFGMEIKYEGDVNWLCIVLLETINTICKEAGEDTNEKLKTYMELGSLEDFYKKIGIENE